jgi:superfamily II DNA or RNA helicase
MKLRSYQQKAFDETRECGKRKVLNFLATGAGKSALFIAYVKAALLKNKKVILVTRRRQLVFQAKEHFNKSGVSSSVVMGNHKGFSSSNPFQICSIDTLVKRDVSFLNDFDLCIIDECHDCTSPKYKDFLFKLSDKTFFIGLTATPFAMGKRVHDFWDQVVKPIEMDELRDQGFLVPAKTYVPTRVDLSKLKTLGGDYKEDDLAELMSQGWILGNIIENYKKLGDNKAALCFCVNKSHAMLMSNEFKKAGIPSEYADEETPQKERDLLIEKLKKGEIKVLCSINIFSTGVDIPEAEIGIMARPTKSEVLWIQQAGRLLRPCRICDRCKTQYDNSPLCPVCGYDKAYIKEGAVLIDHGQNTDRLGHVYLRRNAVTEKQNNKTQSLANSQLKTCSVCFLMFEKGDCPNGCTPELAEREIKEDKDLEMILYDPKSLDKMNFDYERLISDEKRYNSKPNAKWFKLYEAHGDSVYKIKDCPKWVGQYWRKGCPNKCKESKSTVSGDMYVCQKCKSQWTARGNKKSSTIARPSGDKDTVSNSELESF